MTPSASLAPRWAPRDRPLDVCGLLARSGAYAALLDALLARSSETLAALHAVAGDEVIVVLGAAEEIPWIDGGEWLGRDPEAPSLLLPTALAPGLPLTLLERAVLRRFASAETPLAVVPGMVVPLAAARPVRRAKLHALRAERRW